MHNKISNCLALLNATNATLHSINQTYTGTETLAIIIFTLPEPITLDNWDYSSDYDDPDCTFYLLIDGQDGNGGDTILASIIL